MAKVTLDCKALDELNSAETRTLFDAADKLSSLGVGRIVDLPQIIVVGDQSSGKSSVLEAISHVHFPVHGGICTRFATELVLRPGSRRCATASVQFADGSKPAHSLKVEDFNHDDIADIISSAKEEMGISDTGRGFSKDILRLEIQGPDMYPLTLVDLPGIFHTATATQSAEGMAMVMDLVESYMGKPNSIILTIISANNQLANQVVLEKAAKHDPTKTRTLGVITKPDLVPPGSPSEQEYLQIVQGREAVHRLALGWHVLRNRADYEEDLGPRDILEGKFFSSCAWGSIPGADRGISALRAKLSDILHQHIRQSLPAIIQDIRDKLSERELELGRLGQPRTTPEDMRAYLLEIVNNFQRLVRDGIQGYYKDPFFGGFDGKSRKLRANLRNFNRAIRHLLLTYGSTQTVAGYGNDTSHQPAIPEYLEDLLEAYDGRFKAPEVVTWAKLYAELERQVAANQGTELPGYPNMDIVIQLFQKQAEPWQYIAEVHIEEVIKVVKMFLEEVFEHIIGPAGSSTTTAAILSAFVDTFFDAKEQILSTKLNELLRPFKEGYALPLDSDYEEARDEAAAERAAASTEREGGLEQQKGPMIFSSRRKKFHGTDYGIEAMQIFYNMSLRTFTDNLINLAIESCLIQDLHSLFTPKLVNDMDSGKLAEFAAEDEKIRNYRSQLQEEVKLLQKGLEQCRRYRPREKARDSSKGLGISTKPGGKATSGTGMKTLAYRGNGDADADEFITTPPVNFHVSQAFSPKPEAQKIPLNVPKFTGPFGSSSGDHQVAKAPISRSNPPSAKIEPVFNFLSSGTGAKDTASSASSTAQPNVFFPTNTATSSLYPNNSTSQSGGIFGSFTMPPTWGSMAKPSMAGSGGFGGFGATSPSSSSATRPLPGGFGGQIETPWAASENIHPTPEGQSVDPGPTSSSKFAQSAPKQ